MSLSSIASKSEIFADKCVLKGLVPPHPGDLERALTSASKAVGMSVDGQIRSLSTKGRADHRLEPTDDNVPDITENERATIIDTLKAVKNTLNQYVITKLHEHIPRISTKDMRNIVRRMIMKGEVRQPVRNTGEQ